MAPSVDTRALIGRQRELAAQVIDRDDLRLPPELVAGVDAAFPDQGRTTRAAAVLMRFPELETVDEVVFEQATELPYIPGLLSFRELPAILGALERLALPPELVLCDGQGRAHPRRFGIACHLGVATGLATIGVGKSRLCGQHDEPGPEKGAAADLVDGGEVIGRVVRSRDRVRPLYISVGHRVSLATAVDLVLTCTPRYRLPEPVRRADRLAGRHSPA
ncbi:deoxyribonuclease V [Wenzhouxiangella sediminis]|uniref:Endonuclease V n=1 Tax=Wenzhouxiangella sediminis TaxID=1792836 RepID=A0A3E1K8T6_9GAMM|nr:deoxyribonuclease V [Wenzhouxiangella sediminis]RFF30531.1 deoxyribonuclease V [Wenzhouxiangella sediminis]